MKKLLFSLAIAAVLVSALFFGCDHLAPLDVRESVPAANAASTDSERKDVLALKHLQVPNIGEGTLASYVMDFISVTAAPDAGDTRSVQPAPAVVISKTTKITHAVQTGFAEMTADKRPARSAIGPGEIPFYVFTLENQQTGETGFALACGDSRIGAVLAVAEAGNYDDDNPFLGVFYSCLADYIEDTISVYNGITEADIEKALNKVNEARGATAPDLPVSDVGRIGGFIEIYKKDDKLLPVCWNQANLSNTLYNNIIMDVKKPPKDYYYIAGCGPVAIAQIMAFHGNERAIAGKPNPYSKSNAPGYTDIKYDWPVMVACADKDAINAIGVLMYEIGLPGNADSTYRMGGGTTGEGASTGTLQSKVRIAFRNMGYRDPGDFIAYNYSGVRASIDRDEPVMVAGYAKEITTTHSSGIQTKSHKEGHYWVIDACAKLETKVKDKVTGKEQPDPYPLDYVHCNLGWGGSKNGWYISGVFDTRYDNNVPNFPWPDNYGPLPIEGKRSVGESGFYKYYIQMLTGIRPAN